MDDTDRRLIALLREDARAPVAALAKALGVSRGTVQNRIDRMLAQGTLLGFTVRLRAGAEGPRIRAITMIAVEGERAERIIKQLRGYPEIAAIHTTNGRWDLVLELNTESLEAFDKALQRLRQIKGIAGSETSLLLSSYAV
ncbi:MAG: Lrp/AsnC family transcriptional regulator [Alphaproteobacteria bacterium]|nr:Lrp/AsnC family transcriptional regulator [Alphaproteobacteria bacterium]MBU6472155.1 Lrp/AsnC family transcriptional regulator [Alphaproteobacteria bacterium]MDE2011615.1 Lrp/AsnC family transcriptional regulator [Alphaproteobacteria bacterium]MDE2073835.1 Lrp/AsnC family transcriptional regulator [Alphaproteobacteria bacterium]MDE2352455.1 Lrp/AsnC family transcriptional regulator [Alphaproteobacteria bacterium]